jgi:signal transduction histidine kinase
MHEAFNGLLDRLEVSFQQQRRFTGDASHQLRTPLTIIQGQAEVALRRERSPAEYAEILQTIRQQAARLHELVENLLFLARPHSDSNAPTLEPIHLAAWLDDFERSWQESPRAADIHFQIADHTLVAVAHSGMLTEILNNLLDNALKYSAPGDAVTIRLRQSGDSIALSVEDHGIGMTDDDLKHVFQPFFRSEAVRRQGTTGVGLGLSIVNRLAAAMNARVEVETRKSQGSTFTLWLRRAANPTPGSSRPVLHERGRE